MDFTALFNASKENLPLAFLVLSWIVIGFMYREGRQRERDHLATAMQVAPLAAKLTTCVEILERTTNAVLSARRDGGGA